MNTHRLTNISGESIEFNKDKFKDFITQFNNANGCGPRSKFDCWNCPIPNNGVATGVCSKFTGSKSNSDNFLELSLKPIEPVEKTCRLWELEDGKEYQFKDNAHGRYKLEDETVMVLYPLETSWKQTTRVLRFRNVEFVEIKKKRKVKKTVELFAGRAAMNTLRKNCSSGQFFRENNGAKTRQKVSVTFTEVVEE